MENPARGGACLVDGSSWRGMTVALDTKCLPRGGTKGKGQSERLKPGPRRSTQASQVATDRLAEVHDQLGSKRGLVRSGRQHRGGHSDSLTNWSGLFVLCPSQGSEPSARTRQV